MQWQYKRTHIPLSRDTDKDHSVKMQVRRYTHWWQVHTHTLFAWTQNIKLHPSIVTNTWKEGTTDVTWPCLEQPAMHCSKVNQHTHTCHTLHNQHTYLATTHRQVSVLTSNTGAIYVSTFQNVHNMKSPALRVTIWLKRVTYCSVQVSGRHKTVPYR